MALFQNSAVGKNIIWNFDFSNLSFPWFYFRPWQNKSCFGSDTQHTITTTSVDSSLFSPNPSILINSLLIGNKVFVEMKQLSSLFPVNKISTFMLFRPPISSRSRPWPKSPKQTSSAQHCGRSTRTKSAFTWRSSGRLRFPTKTRQSWRRWRTRSASLSRRIRPCSSSFSIRRKSRRSTKVKNDRLSKKTQIVRRTHLHHRKYRNWKQTQDWIQSHQTRQKTNPVCQLQTWLIQSASAKV